MFLGCVRKVDNAKIADINSHNKISFTPELFKQFKELNPLAENKDNPYKYSNPSQGYAELKDYLIKQSVEFVGPLTKEQFLNNTTFQNNKHYLERVPAILYRNSMQALIKGNSKHIQDLQNKSILYHNKRKPLRFIKKSDEQSILVNKSDNIFTIKGNNICFGTNFDESYQLEQEIISLKKKLKRNNVGKDLRLEIEKKITVLQEKLDKDYSYLGILKIVLPKKNKTTKAIDYNTINSIRIKKAGEKFTVSLTFDYTNQYIPTLLRLDNNQEIVSKEALAKYIKELTDTVGADKAIAYLQERVLGLDRGVNKRVATSDKEKPFLEYTEEVKAKIKKLKKQIKYHNKQLKRRKVGSKGYGKALARYRKLNKTVANIRKDVNHKATYRLVTEYKAPIYALEKLNVKGMTKKPMPKVNSEKSLTLKHNVKLNLTKEKLSEILVKLEEYYKVNAKGLKYKDIVGEYKLVFDKNMAAAKAGLNESNLNQNWGQFGTFMDYKAVMNGKIVIEVDPKYTSQECSKCGFIDKKSRAKTKFCCTKCGHEEHADTNASKVISKRVYKTLLKLEIKLSLEEGEKIQKQAVEALILQSQQDKLSLSESCTKFLVDNSL